MLLKRFALKHQESFGLGTVFVNLPLLNTEKIDQLGLLNAELDELQEPTIHQPLSYIPHDNFWFKMISLKIKKKHKIDLQEENSKDKIFVVLIKDVALEHFSIYTIKQSDKNYDTLNPQID